LLKQGRFARKALPFFFALIAPSDSPFECSSELRLSALYLRLPPREMAGSMGSQALPLCSFPACCRLRPGSLDSFISPTDPLSMSAFARRLQARRLQSQLSQLWLLGIRWRGSQYVHFRCGPQACFRSLAAYNPAFQRSLRERLSIRFNVIGHPTTLESKLLGW